MPAPTSKIRIVIVAYDRLNNTPAVFLATKGWLESVEAHEGERVMNVAWDHKAFVAFVAPEGRGTMLQPIGVLTWQHEEWRNQVFVNQSWVEPAWRGRGVYRALWAALVDKAKAIPGVRRVSSITHMGNTRMRAIAAAQGRVEEAVVISLELPDQAVPVPERI